MNEAFLTQTPEIEQLLRLKQTKVNYACIKHYNMHALSIHMQALSMHVLQSRNVHRDQRSIVSTIFAGRIRSYTLIVVYTVKSETNTCQSRETGNSTTDTTKKTCTSWKNAHSHASDLISPHFVSLLFPVSQDASQDHC